VYRHDGKTLLDDMLRPSKNTPWTSWLGQIFKYGASVWRAPNVPDKTTSKLNRISSLDRRYPFRTTEALVNALGLSSEVSSTGAQLLRAAGISPYYEASVILPETEKRFRQRPEHLTNLALSMALQEADKGSRYVGGQILPVLHDMLDASGAQLSLSTRVTAIRRLELAPRKFQWVLQTQGPHEEEYRVVDKVVLAAPWKSEELEVDFGSGQKPSPPAVQYMDDHITFFTSRFELNIDRLGNSESGPRRLLMSAAILQQPLQGIREIAFIKDIVQVENHELVTDHLYRVSSNQPLSNSTLDYLLGAAEMVTWKHENYVSTSNPVYATNTNLHLPDRERVPLAPSRGAIVYVRAA
jgi:Prenylcysteine lyase